MGQSYALTLAGFARMNTMTAELGCDIGYQSYPSLIAAESEAHLPELERLFQEKKEAGLDVRWLEGQRASGGRAQSGARLGAGGQLF